MRGYRRLGSSAVQAQANAELWQCIEIPVVLIYVNFHVM